MGYLSKTMVACALVVTLAAATPAPDPVLVEVGINAAYDAQCAALIANDPDAWAKTLASDFVGTSPGGQTSDAKRARDAVATLLASAKIEKCRIVPESIDMDGADAVTDTAVTMSATQANGEAIAIERHAVDRWTPIGDAWLLKRSNVSEQTVTVDGKIAQHDVAKGEI